MKYTVLVNHQVEIDDNWKGRTQRKQDIVEVNDLKELTNMFNQIENIKIIEKTIT